MFSRPQQAPVRIMVGAKSGRVPLQTTVAEHLLMFPCKAVSPAVNLRVPVCKVVARYSFHQLRLRKACDSCLGAFGMGAGDPPTHLGFAASSRIMHEAGAQEIACNQTD